MRPTSLLITAMLAACGGGGQYGYDREYVTTSEEDDLLEEVTEANYEDVKRDPSDYRSALVSWFGVVTNVDLDASTGRALVSMTHRTHQARHLCGDERASSCRVTVSERAGGPFSAELDMRPEDREGQDRLWVGSLVRAYGSPNGEFDDEGGPILTARWYRHWPRGKYVTTGAARSMRR
jgi:hypothetical protein